MTILRPWADRFRPQEFVQIYLKGLRLRPRLQRIAWFALLPAAFLLAVLMFERASTFFALTGRLATVELVTREAAFEGKAEAGLEALRLRQSTALGLAESWPDLARGLNRLRQDQALLDAQGRIEDGLTNLAEAGKNLDDQETWISSLRDDMPSLSARTAQAGWLTRDSSLSRLGLALTWAVHLPVLDAQLSRMRDLQAEVGRSRRANASQRQDMLILQRQFSSQMERALFDLESAFSAETGLKARLIDDFGDSPFGAYQIGADRFAAASADALEEGEAADPLLHDYAAKRYTELRQSREALQNRLQTLLAERYRSERWQALAWAGLLGLGTLLALTTGLWLAGQAANSVTVPLSNLGATARAVAQDHDLARRASEQGDDELAELGRDFNAMVQGLAQALSRLGDSAAALRQAAGALQGAADDQAGSAVRQASALQQALVTGEELRQVARIASQRAKTVQTQAMAARAAAALGNESLLEGEREMASMGITLRDLQGRLTELPQRVERVDAVVDSAKELALQTNVLALNAAIEALRAGNSGRSFGLVASEMRSLADRSGEEANRVKSLLEDINRFTREAVGASQAGGAKLSAGLQRVAQSADSFRSLAETAEKNSEQAGEIGKAVEEQSVGLDQLFLALADQDKLMRETEVASRRVQELVGPLMETADELQGQSNEWRA